jgi:hypothetical protein
MDAILSLSLSLSFCPDHQFLLDDRSNRPVTIVESLDCRLCSKVAHVTNATEPWFKMLLRACR